jgi:hypothetical protein
MDSKIKKYFLILVYEDNKNKFMRINYPEEIVKNISLNVLNFKYRTLMRKINAKENKK